MNEIDSQSDESENELCIVFEKNTNSSSKASSTDVTKSKNSAVHSRKRQLSPSQSSSHAPLKKGTKTPASGICKQISVFFNYLHYNI